MLAEQNRKPDEAPGAEAHPEPTDVPDEERPAVKQPRTARAGQIIDGGLVRRIMVISLALLIAAFAVLYLIFF